MKYLLMIMAALALISTASATPSRPAAATGCCHDSACCKAHNACCKK